jgi:hypothetical protein
VAKVVVHLDPTCFRGKFPDRDRLIDHDESLDRVGAAIRVVILSDLEHAKSTLDPLTFCLSRYDQAQSINALEVFESIHVMPGSWFKTITGTPFDGAEWENSNMERGLSGRTVVTKEDLDSGEVQIAVLDTLTTDVHDNVDRWNLARAAGIPILVKGLSREHWAHDMAALSDDSIVEVHVYEEDRAAAVAFRGNTYTDIVPCGSVVYSSDKIAAVEVGWCVGVNGEILVPKGAKFDADVLRQVESYVDEWGVLNEDSFCSDADLFRQKFDEAMQPDGKARFLMQVQAAVKDLKTSEIGMQISLKMTDQGLIVEAV